MSRYLMLISMIAIVSCSGGGDNPPPGALQGGASAPSSTPPGVNMGATSAPTTTPATTATAAAVEPAKEKSVLEEMKAEQLQEFYNPSGKRDPFKPFEGGEIIYTSISRAPLERFELNQLELTAIVWGIARPKVLFRAPDGYSYIAQVGTGIGRNRGRITKVTKNRVLIAEEFRDPSGQYVARESEFKMDSDDKSEKVTKEMDLKYSDE